MKSLLDKCLQQFKKQQFKSENSKQLLETLFGHDLSQFLGKNHPHLFGMLLADVVANTDQLTLQRLFIYLQQQQKTSNNIVSEICSGMVLNGVYEKSKLSTTQVSLIAVQSKCPILEDVLFEDHLKIVLNPQQDDSILGPVYYFMQLRQFYALQNIVQEQASVQIQLRLILNYVRSKLMDFQLFYETNQQQSQQVLFINELQPFSVTKEKIVIFKIKFPTLISKINKFPLHFQLLLSLNSVQKTFKDALLLQSCNVEAIQMLICGDQQVNLDYEEVDYQNLVKLILIQISSVQLIPHINYLISRLCKLQYCNLLKQMIDKIFELNLQQYCQSLSFLLYDQNNYVYISMFINQILQYDHAIFQLSKIFELALQVNQQFEQINNESLILGFSEKFVSLCTSVQTNIKDKLVLLHQISRFIKIDVINVLNKVDKLIKIQYSDIELVGKRIHDYIDQNQINIEIDELTPYTIYIIESLLCSKHFETQRKVFINTYLQKIKFLDEEQQINILHSYVLGKCKTLFNDQLNQINNSENIIFDTNVQRMVNQFTNNGLFQFLFFIDYQQIILPQYAGEKAFYAILQNRTLQYNFNYNIKLIFDNSDINLDYKQLEFLDFDILVKVNSVINDEILEQMILQKLNEQNIEEYKKFFDIQKFNPLSQELIKPRKQVMLQNIKQCSILSEILFINDFNESLIIIYLLSFKIEIKFENDKLIVQTKSNQKNIIQIIDLTDNLRQKEINFCSFILQCSEGSVNLLVYINDKPYFYSFGVQNEILVSIHLQKSNSLFKYMRFSDQCLPFAAIQYMYQNNDKIKYQMNGNIDQDYKFTIQDSITPLQLQILSNETNNFVVTLYESQHCSTKPYDIEMSNFINIPVLKQTKLPNKLLYLNISQFKINAIYKKQINLTNLRTKQIIENEKDIFMNESPTGLLQMICQQLKSINYQQIDIKNRETLLINPYILKRSVEKFRSNMKKFILICLNQAYNQLENDEYLEYLSYFIKNYQNDLIDLIDECAFDQNFELSIFKSIIDLQLDNVQGIISCLTYKMLEHNLLFYEQHFIEYTKIDIISCLLELNFESDLLNYQIGFLLLIFGSEQIFSTCIKQNRIQILQYCFEIIISTIQNEPKQIQLQSFRNYFIKQDTNKLLKYIDDVMNPHVCVITQQLINQMPTTMLNFPKQISSSIISLQIIFMIMNQQQTNQIVQQLKISNQLIKIDINILDIIAQMQKISQQPSMILIFLLYQISGQSIENMVYQLLLNETKYIPYDYRQIVFDQDQLLNIELQIADKDDIDVIQTSDELILFKLKKPKQHFIEYQQTTIDFITPLWINCQDFNITQFKQFITKIIGQNRSQTDLILKALLLQSVCYCKNIKNQKLIIEMILYLTIQENYASDEYDDCNLLQKQAQSLTSLIDFHNKNAISFYMLLMNILITLDKIENNQMYQWYIIRLVNRIGIEEKDMKYQFCKLLSYSFEGNIKLMLLRNLLKFLDNRKIDVEAINKFKLPKSLQQLIIKYQNQQAKQSNQIEIANIVAAQTISDVYILQQKQQKEIKLLDNDLSSIFIAAIVNQIKNLSNLPNDEKQIINKIFSTLAQTKLLKFIEENVYNELNASCYFLNRVLIQELEATHIFIQTQISDSLEKFFYINKQQDITEIDRKYMQKYRQQLCRYHENLYCEQTPICFIKSNIMIENQLLLIQHGYQYLQKENQQNLIPKIQQFDFDYLFNVIINDQSINGTDAVLLINKQELIIIPNVYADYEGSVCDSIEYCANSQPKYQFKTCLKRIYNNKLKKELLQIIKNNQQVPNHFMIQFDDNLVRKFKLSEICGVQRFQFSGQPDSIEIKNLFCPISLTIANQANSFCKRIYNEVKSKKENYKQIFPILNSVAQREFLIMLLLKLCKQNFQVGLIDFEKHCEKRMIGDSDIDKIMKQIYPTKSIDQVQLMLFLNKSVQNQFYSEQTIQSTQIVIKHIKSFPVLEYPPNPSSMQEIINIDEWIVDNETNYQLIAKINHQAQRSQLQIANYPIFPWVARDFRYPPPAQTEQNRENLITKYNETKMFQFATLPSAAGSVIYFNVRVQPFEIQMVVFQDGKYDVPDRLFRDIKLTYLSSLDLNSSNCKELVQDAFQMPIMINFNKFQLGKLQTGEQVDDVDVNQPIFIVDYLDQLNSSETRERIIDWLQQLFGDNQMKPEFCNVYPSANYFETSDFMSASEFGIIPKKVSIQCKQQEKSQFVVDLENFLAQSKTQQFSFSQTFKLNPFIVKQHKSLKFSVIKYRKGSPFQVYQEKNKRISVFYQEQCVNTFFSREWDSCQFVIAFIKGTCLEVRHLYTSDLVFSIPLQQIFENLDNQITVQFCTDQNYLLVQCQNQVTLISCCGLVIAKGLVKGNEKCYCKQLRKIYIFQSFEGKMQLYAVGKQGAVLQKQNLGIQQHEYHGKVQFNCHPMLRPFQNFEQHGFAEKEGLVNGITWIAEVDNVEE